MNRNLLFSLLLMIVFLISGCVYYNTFFNAKKYFREAQEIGLDLNGRPKSTAVQKYNQTIQRCGFILTEYKNSKYADDALYLLARAMYYKGNNYIQSIEKFNDLIKFYPESEFVPSAKIYIARAYYQFNQKQNAFSLLQEFTNDQLYSKHHPEALLTLADYYLAEENYTQANHYYQRVIEKFPKSDYFETAYFQQGKTYHENGNYTRSNEIFLELLKTRVNKKLKLDARYYISYNTLLLNDPLMALNVINRLLKDEYRPEKLPPIQILKARSLAKMGEHDDAVSIFQNIITNNNKTAIAAEASFYLAETYFKEMGEYELAITAYNDVKNQDRNSPLVENALSRSTVVSEIIQFYNPDQSIATEELINQKFRLAEYYIEVLELPDSALTIYDQIINQEAIIHNQIDSLTFLFSELNRLSADSLLASELEAFLAVHFVDSLYFSDNQKVLPEYAPEDSIIIDSTLMATYAPEPEINREMKISWTGQQITSGKYNLENDLTLYQQKFIPFARFIKFWLFSKVYEDSARAETEYQNLLQHSPENKYTAAAQALINGEPVELISPQEFQDREEYNSAIDLIGEDPGVAAVRLEEIAADQDHNYWLKANYSAGYLYYFILGDTLTSRKFFDLVIAQDSLNYYRPHIQSFYDGEKFQILPGLDILNEVDSLVSISDSTLTEESTSPPEDASPILFDPSVYDNPAQIISRREIQFPDDYPLVDIRLPVQIEVQIFANGELGEIIMEDTNIHDYQQFITIIRDNLLTWTILPATLNGNNVDSWLSLAIDIIPNQNE